ncbi:hypothetical protein [Streptomyces erythrochromogenes]|uniref:hypothetical protein n=1 Tax=Streptomyces erythrochromogenes TaxID=285574 RepID=UPI0037CE5956
MTVQPPAQPPAPDAERPTGPPAQPPPAGPSGRPWWVEHTALLVAAVGLLSACLGFLAALLSSPWLKPDRSEPAKPTASIKVPGDPTVGTTTPFSGTIQNAPPGYAVWAIVRDVDSGAVYPKFSPCSVQADQWDCEEVFPVKGDAGSRKQSALEVVLVDARGASDIMGWVADTQYLNQQRKFTVPSGTIPLDSMRVVRGDK